jgi:membrane-bound ClpP family serine protease
MWLLKLMFLAFLPSGLLAVAGGLQTLTAQAEVAPAFADRIHGFLAAPSALFLLFILAAACLYIELSHPGAIASSASGALALILFLFSAGSIQPNWAARLARGEGFVRLGESVRITGIDGMTLIVEPVSPALHAPREVNIWN